MAVWIATALAVAFLLGGCKFDGAYDLPLPGNKVSKGDGFLINADFADALNVVPRTSVMLDDVAVGQVTEVDRSGWHARVQMRIRKDLDLPKNVEIDVRQTSLLGEKYIALVNPEAPEAARLAAGDFIPMSRTGRNPEVEEVLGALSMLLSGGGVGQLKTISVELNKMLNGRQDTARHMLGQLDTMVGALNEQRDDIVTAMDSIDKLSATLVKETSTISAALDSMGPALKVLNEQHRGLMKMLRELDNLGVVGTRVLNASKDDIIASLKHLEPVLRELADASDSLPRGLALLASFPFPKEAANIAMGDYANALFKMDFNLDAILRDPGGNLPDIFGVCKVLNDGCKDLLDALDQICALGGKDSLICKEGHLTTSNIPGLASLPGINLLFGKTNSAAVSPNRSLTSGGGGPLAPSGAPSGGVATLTDTVAGLLGGGR